MEDEKGTTVRLAPVPGSRSCMRHDLSRQYKPSLRPSRGCPLLAVLLRAACLFDLVEAAVLTPLEAFGRLEHAVHAVSPCACEREILDAFAQHDRERARRKSWPTPEQQHDLPPNWATMPFDALWRHLNNPGRWRPSKHRNRNQ